MTSPEVLLPADAARARVRADLDLIEAAQARLRAADTDLVGNAFRVEVAQRLEDQQRVNRGLSYRIFGEIADPADGPDDPGLPTDLSVRDLLWTRLRITRGELNRRFRIAARIRPRRSLTGPPIAPQLPELAAAVQAGQIGEDHIAAITKALDRLPAAVGAADRDEAERALVGYAQHQDAQFVTAVGYRIEDCLNPDGNFTDTDRARRRGLTLGRQGADGMSRLHGYLDPETRSYLEAITAAIRPGHRLPQTPDAAPETPDGPESAEGPETPEASEAPEGAEQRDTRSPEQRCHDAVKLALRQALESGNLGTHRGVPVTVIITTRLDELEQAARAAADPTAAMPAPARTGGGSRLPMRDLIRMASNSMHYLAVFDNHSERPLYLGRSKRLATTDHRIICHARDHGCTRPNCLAPGYHCEVHHSPDWGAGGQTDADKLHFACGADHSGATNGHYTTTVTDEGRLAWTNGTDPPQVNRIHHPEELLHREDP